MDDLISRQAAIDALDGKFDITGRKNAETIRDYINGVNKKLRELPSAERRGRWIPDFNGKFKGGAYWFHCSRCGRIVPDVRNGGWNYCPNCGADMRGEQNDQ